MSDAKFDDLTSAEAGVVWMTLRCRDADIEARGWDIEACASAPLAEFLEALQGSSTSVEDADDVESARLRRWVDRAEGDHRSPLRDVADRIFEVLDDEQTSQLHRHMARRRLRAGLEEYGGDVSMAGTGYFDVRQWIDGGDDRSLTHKCIAVGIMVVAAVDDIAVRRRLAATVAQLPSSAIPHSCHRRIEQLSPSAAVSRRVCEVYGRLADGDYRPSQELAILGLFFVVSASVLRHNGGLDDLERQLSGSLQRACRKYRRVCLRSAQSDLFPAIAELLDDAIGVLEATSPPTEACDE